MKHMAPNMARAIGAFMIVLSAGTVARPANAADGVLSYSTYGTPGLLDMPTAQSDPDAELAVTLSHFAGSTRTTLTFQVTPRLSGSFRYSGIQNWLIPTGDGTYDRSFDLRYMLVKEGRYRPAIAIGLQDFIGTGIYTGEYVVATKHITPRLTVTGGLGWGRLGSYGGFTNPLGVLGSSFKTRPSSFTGNGGIVESAKWFRGDAALFGGVAYQATDRLILKAEYSSDAYVRETARDHFTHNSPFNFGIDYKLSKSTHAQLYYLYGSQLGASVSFALNPKDPAVSGGGGAAPVPVKPRGKSAADLGWAAQTAQGAKTRETALAQTKAVLAAEGIELVAMKLNGTNVRLQIRNTRHSALPQTIGRTARILTHVMPASVETFHIEPMVNGMIPSTTTIRRSDMERLEHAPDNTRLSYDAATITRGSRRSDDGRLRPLPGLFPRFSWGLAPYLGTSFFDPDQPIRLDVGAALSARYEFSPGVSISGAIHQRLLGNVGDGRAASSVLPHVRTDATLYAQTTGPVLDNLTFDYFFQPAKNTYAHMSVGYFESMYGGVSGELLWKPLNSRLALGVELNYVAKRDFDQLLGFQSYRTVTGHASAYYDFGNGFHGQLDAGRYLAGDWGSTLTLDREFNNGWKVGGFVTLTDVSFDDFGEGSFDKGIRITIPLDWALGSPNTKKLTTTLRPLTRDGGARLNINNRLYEQVREAQNPILENRWGRFWR